MADIVRLKRGPRPLRTTYSPSTPYIVRRCDQDDGSISYEVYDERPEFYRRVCAISDDEVDNPYAKHDAEQIVRGLNFLIQCGKESLPPTPRKDED